jgi:hypothetical protein
MREILRRKCWRVLLASMNHGCNMNHFTELESGRDNVIQRSKLGEKGNDGRLFDRFFI